MDVSPRKAGRRTHRRWLMVSSVVCVALGVGVVAATAPQPAAHHRASVAGADRDVSKTLDSDGDGITDRVEVAGWKTALGGPYRTSPTSADTDGDGLSDAYEAGPFIALSSGDYAYAGRSDPVRSDTDGDGLDDATELDGGFDAWAEDSDGDDLNDLDEIEFGSNPLIANADGDHLDDAAELRAGSDPNVYDLSSREAGAALIEGASFGEWTWGARHLGRLSDQQINSWQYLVGSLVAGVVGVGDGRDIISDLGSRRWGAALVSLVGAIPVLGDSAKVTEGAITFAKRGGAATRAAMYLIAKAPGLSAATRTKIFRVIARVEPIGARLTADEAVQGSNASAALPTSRPISLSAVQNGRKDAIVRQIAHRGYEDIRVDQQQVDAAGQVVGINRPDIQATAPDGTRHFWEFDTSSDQGPIHESRILSNDATSVVCLLTQGTDYRMCVS